MSPKKSERRARRRDVRPLLAVLMLLILGVTAALAEPGRNKSEKATGAQVTATAGTTASAETDDDDDDATDDDDDAAEGVTGGSDDDDATDDDETTETDGDATGGSAGSQDGTATTDTAAPATDAGATTTSGTTSTSTSTTTSTSTSTSTGTATSGSGTVQIGCKWSHQNNDDPIVFPSGLGASHSHEFFGNTKTNAFSTYASLTANSGTTCEFPGDTAAYWVPTLLDGNGNRIPVERATVYYRDRPQESQPVTPFPPDFRMIAGPARSPWGGALRWGWNCDGTTLQQSVQIDCGSMTVRAKVFFPMCAQKVGDKIVTDSANHWSHVAYEVSNKLGCPATHPVKLPAINVNVRYKVTNCIVAKCRLVSDGPGDVPGSTIHSDFWNTWQQQALVNMVNQHLN